MKDNVKVRVDLAKFYGAQKVRMADGTEGIFIPAQANRVYFGAKGWYLDLVAFEHQTEYQSHFMKLDLPKEVTDGMTPEQRQQVPVVGSIRPMVSRATAGASVAGGQPMPAWMNAPAPAPAPAEPARRPLYETAREMPSRPSEPIDPMAGFGTLGDPMPGFNEKDLLPF